MCLLVSTIIPDMSNTTVLDSGGTNELLTTESLSTEGGDGSGIRTSQSISDSTMIGSVTTQNPDGTQDPQSGFTTADGGSLAGSTGKTK